jgi:hypothetical protein
MDHQDKGGQVIQYTWSQTGFNSVTGLLHLQALPIELMASVQRDQTNRSIFANTTIISY